MNGFKHWEMQNRDCSFPVEHSLVMVKRGLALAPWTLVYSHGSVRAKAKVSLWKHSFLIIGDIFTEGFSILISHLPGLLTCLWNPFSTENLLCCLSSGMFMFKVLLNLLNSFNIEHVPAINWNPRGTNWSHPYITLYTYFLLLHLKHRGLILQFSIFQDLCCNVGKDCTKIEKKIIK